MTSKLDGAGGGANEVIRVTVRALRSARQVDAAVLARHIGISRQALYNRLNGQAPWLASEVAGLAEFFNCSVQDLYDGVIRVREQGLPRVDNVRHIRCYRTVIQHFPSSDGVYRLSDLATPIRDLAAA